VTRSASPARSSRSGIRSHSAASASVRRRPPLSDSAAVLDPAEAPDRGEAARLERGSDGQQGERRAVGEQRADEPRLDQLGEERRAGRHGDDKETREPGLRGGRAGVSRDPVALGRGRREPPEEPGEVSAAELLGEERGGERVDPGRAEPRLERTQGIRRRRAEVEVRPHAGQLRRRGALDRRRGGGERSAHGAPARERVGDRGCDLRHPALNREPVARPAAGQRPGRGAGAGERQERRRSRADHHEPCEEERYGPEHGEPPPLGVGGRVTLLARPAQGLHRRRDPTAEGRAGDDGLTNGDRRHPARRGRKENRGP